MRARMIGLLISLLCVPAMAQTARINTGLLQGTTEGAALVFRGIPFAAPPVGPLRWRAPRPAAPWIGMRPATAFGPPCPQAGSPAAPPISASEDCLTLTVWRPAGHGRYPVLLWLYGGGFISGDSANPLTDGAKLAERGVVVVAANYRFGALGYVAHPALSAASPDHVSGNYGLLDQIAALKWIKANISAFDGDPQRVTVGGQSAGGIGVDMLMTAPAAAGMFQRAIVQSAPITGLVPPLPTLTEAQAFGERFAADRGAHTLKELYALTPEQLVTMSPQEQALASPFRPTIDGHVLPDHPLRLFAQGRAAKVPLLIGSTTGESARITPMAPTPEGFEAWVLQTYPHEATAILAAYPGHKPATLRDEWIAVKADDMASGVRRMARFHTLAGDKTFVYRFDQAPPGPDQARARAYHGSDLPYVFGNFQVQSRPWTAQDRALSAEMMGYWVNFITTGDPNGAGLPPWAAYAPGDQQEMQLSADSRMIPIPHLERLPIFETPAIP